MWVNDTPGEVLVGVGVMPGIMVAATSEGVAAGDTVTATVVDDAVGETFVAMGKAVGVAVKQPPLTTIALNRTIRAIGLWVRLLFSG